jgi:phage gp29-like protein
VVKEPTILGPDGRPIVRAALSREVATPTVAGVRRTHEDRVATGLTPEKLGTLLRDASTGQARAYLTLAEEMEERYLHYASQLQTRRLAIDGVDITVEADKGVSSKIIDAVTELVNDPGLGAAVGFMSDGIAKGLSAVEMLWEFERGQLRPVDYVWRDPRFFVFDELSLTKLRLAVDGKIEGEELPEAKFLRHLPHAKMGIPYRRGVARPAAWGYILQQFALQDWAGFSETFGMPLRVGKYHAGASPDDKRTLLKAVVSIANDAAAIIPQGMDIDFHEVSGQRGEAVFGGLLEYVDKQISKLVVGQTMTADDGASLGQAKIHNEVRLDILRSDCRQLSQTLTRDLIRPFIDLNFGVQDSYPRIEMPVTDPEDIEALSNSLSRLVPLGLKVSQREIREKHGLSEPSADEELLTPPAAAQAAPAQVPPAAPPKGKAARPRKLGALAAAVNDHRRSCRCAACMTFLAAEVGAPDAVGEIDQLFDGIDDWEALAAGVTAPLAKILAEARSFEEALAMLDAAGPDSSAMARRLAELTAISRGIGDIED